MRGNGWWVLPQNNYGDGHAVFLGGPLAASGSQGGDPVRLSDGTLNLQTTDLESDGFGAAWGITRSWTNNLSYMLNSHVGMGWDIDQEPSIVQPLGNDDGDPIEVVTGGASSQWFDTTGGSLTPLFDGQDTLAYDTGDDRYVLTDTAGDRTTLYGFGTDVPAAEQGTFAGYAPASGSPISVTGHNDAGAITSEQRSQTVGAVTTTESLLFTYYGGSVSDAGQLANVTLERTVASGGTSTTSVVRQVAYTYYGSDSGDTAYGDTNELRTAAVEDGQGNILSEDYYRYYTADNTDAAGLGDDTLEDAFNATAFARLQAALPSGTTAFTASQAQVAPFATLQLDYGSVVDDSVTWGGNSVEYVMPQVTWEVVGGMGTTENGSVGQGTYTFSYHNQSDAIAYNSADPDGYNDWSTYTVETEPSGLTDTVYCNRAGQAMLDVQQDGSGGQWLTYYNYDDHDHLALTAEPSAVLGYDADWGGLVDDGSGTYADLSPASGLVHITQYFGDDSPWGITDPNAAAQDVAGETTPGAGPAGFVEDTQVETGWDNPSSLAVLTGTDYYAHTASTPGTGGADPATIYPVADTIVYRTAGSAGDTTTYAYTWQADASGNPTFAPATLTTTLPDVSAAEDGPGTADVTTDVFDADGNVAWERDADGYIAYAAYDVATGGLLKTIADVNTADTADFSGSAVPSGWATPAGGGLELITAYVLDNQGRATEETSPAGRITYTTYDDVHHVTRTYAGWTTAGGTSGPTGPVQLLWDDWADGYAVAADYTYTPTSAAAPTGTDAVTNLTGLTVDKVDDGGQVTEQDAYHDLSGVVVSPASPSADAWGTAAANYYVTAYGYAGGGRQYLTTDPDGTITKQVYNDLGWVTQEQVGTSAGMTDVADLQYDADGDLTQETDHPGAGQPDRVTAYTYDGRDEQVTKTDGAGSAQPILTVTGYDNAGDATETQQYAGTAATATALRAESKSAYDDQGRVYQQTTYGVAQANGAVGTGDTTSTYYDHRGLVLATASPAGLWAQYAYDGAGRTTAEYQGQLLATPSWSAAGSVADTVVLTQARTTYDADGNVTGTVTGDRLGTDSPTAAGPLGDAAGTGGPAARVSYAASYYDAADRVTATVDVGTNGGAAWARPGTVPARSATALVTSYAYNAAGEVAAETDPEVSTANPDGIVTAYTYDALGRELSTVADYTGTFAADGTPVGSTPTDATDQTTAYTYDGDGNVTTMTAVLPPGQDGQTTTYVYGVTTGGGGGSGVNDNDLLAQTQYPDPATGDSTAAQAETYAYDALGEQTGYADRNGTTHAYAYDAQGRMTSDSVTHFGTGVDTTVGSLGYTYDDAGLLASATSYGTVVGAGPAPVVNQDVDTYDGFGQLAAEEQAVAGPASPASPTVGYTYDAGNGDRPTGIVYPNGRTVGYNYGVPGSLTNAASQVTSLSDATGPIQSYSYLGLDTPVTFADGNGTELTYLSTSGSTGDAGDKVTGLDRFGRVADQNWVNGSGASVDEFKYAYDPDSNVLSRNDTVTPGQSEAYTYDGLNRLTTFARGTLNGAGTAVTGTPTGTESWSLDALGNWTANTLNGTTATRTNSAQNQVGTVTTPAAGGANATATLGYDKDGNTLTDATGQQYVYDAWNRLVAVKNGRGRGGRDLHVRRPGPAGDRGRGGRDDRPVLQRPVAGAGGAAGRGGHDPVRLEPVRRRRPGRAGRRPVRGRRPDVRRQRHWRDHPRREQPVGRALQ